MCDVLAEFGLLKSRAPGLGNACHKGTYRRYVARLFDVLEEAEREVSPYATVVYLVLCALQGGGFWMEFAETWIGSQSFPGTKWLETNMISAAGVFAVSACRGLAVTSSVFPLLCSACELRLGPQPSKGQAGVMRKEQTPRQKYACRSMLYMGCFNMLTLLPAIGEGHVLVGIHHAQDFLSIPQIVFSIAHEKGELVGWVTALSAACSAASSVGMDVSAAACAAGDFFLPTAGVLSDKFALPSLLLGLSCSGVAVHSLLARVPSGFRPRVASYLLVFYMCSSSATEVMAFVSQISREDQANVLMTLDVATKLVGAQILAGDSAAATATDEQTALQDGASCSSAPQTATQRTARGFQDWLNQWLRSLKA